MARTSAHETDESTPLLGGGSEAQDTAARRRSEPSSSPVVRRLPNSSTNASWGDPEGLPVRGPNDENVVIFRQALGINSATDGTPGDASAPAPAPAPALDVEAGRRRATGVYAAVLAHQRKKRAQYLGLLSFIYGCHVAQIVVGAALAVMGPTAQDHKTAITALGATNTVVAGCLALITQQGLAEKLHKDEVEFRKLQAWMEETEALLAMGIIGRDRRDVGALVESAFRRYNATEAREETNQPDAYIPAGDLPSQQRAVQQAQQALAAPKQPDVDADGHAEVEAPAANGH